MWFQDFTAIQILCEINFGDSRSSKTAVFATFRALKFVNLVHFNLQKVHNIIKSTFGASKYVKMADFAFLQYPKLISRKI